MALVSNCRIDAVPSAVEVEASGGRWLNLSADDVLGLQSDARVREALLGHVRKLGLSAAPAATLRETAEARLASLCGQEAAVITSDADAVLVRGGSRAMVVDVASRHLAPLARAVVSPDGLGPADSGVVVVEAVHPLRGDLAPLTRYVEVTAHRPLTLWVVDPCGLGVLGPTGGGAVEHLNVARDVELVIAALGHGIAGAGVVVAGKRELIDPMRDVLPPCPAAHVGATLRALDILADEPHRRQRAWDVAGQVLQRFKELGLDTGPAVTPWIPLWLGDEALAHRWLEGLADALVAARAMVAPSSSRLLVCVPATATAAQVGSMLDVVTRLTRRYGAPAPQLDGPSAVELARPHSYVMSAQAGARWTVATAPSVPEERTRLPVPRNLADALETLAWRATSTPATIRRATEAVRGLVMRRRPDDGPPGRRQR